MSVFKILSTPMLHINFFHIAEQEVHNLGRCSSENWQLPSSSSLVASLKNEDGNDIDNATNQRFDWFNDEK